MSACRHCGNPKGNRARGLCWACSRTPEIRDEYPSTSKYAVKGPKGSSKLPSDVALVLPGTEERIQVYAARLARGEHWQHPEDKRVIDLT